MTGRAPSKRAVLIAGATASGKSALALALAEELGGSIINADSMQVYRDLRVITARPAAAEEVRIPHLLYGHVDVEAHLIGEASFHFLAVSKTQRAPERGESSSQAAGAQHQEPPAHLTAGRAIPFTAAGLRG